MRTVVRVALVLVGLAGAAVAGDWPQFMGPNRDGTAPGETLLTTWPEGGPKILWTVPVGRGFAGAAIRDGKVYLLDRMGRKGDALRCLDLATGKEAWRFAYDAPGRLAYDGSRSTPTVGDKLIVTVGPFGHIHCVDRATHKAVWRKHLVEDFDSKRHQWGVSQSALYYKDTVVVAPLGRKVGVVALERATGKVVWQSPPFGPMRYMSPQVATIGGVEQIVMMSKSHVAGVEPGTGKLLWKYGGYRCAIPINTPKVLPEGRLFVTGGYGAGSVMLRVAKGAGGFEVTERFRLRRLGAHIHTPLFHEGHLYAQFNTKKTKDGLACVGLDGAVKWKTDRSPNFDWGGHILADGHIVIMDGVTGILRLVKPDPAGYKEVASAKVLQHKPIWGPLALAAGKLVCRDQKQMRCVVVGRD
jgi:hypothetical protein